jgi:hypothetical protein
MPEGAQLPRPVVRTRPGLHRHLTRRQSLEEVEHLCAPQLSAKHRPTPRIGAMHLKHVLRQIQTDD